jgi:hypothetical protein
MNKILSSCLLLILSVPLYAGLSWTPVKLSIYGNDLCIPKAENVSGLDIGIIGAESKRVYGIQTGLGVECENCYGLQTALGSFAKNNVYGLQASLLVSGAKEVYGIQIGGLLCGADKMYGIRVGTIIGFPNRKDGAPMFVASPNPANDYECDYYGLQIGLLGSVVDQGAGVQMGLLNDANANKGIQIGLYNECGHATGLQLGVFNSCFNLRGLQIGLINRVANHKHSIARIFPIMNWDW